MGSFDVDGDYDAGAISLGHLPRPSEGISFIGCRDWRSHEQPNDTAQRFLVRPRCRRRSATRCALMPFIFSLMRYNTFFCQCSCRLMRRPTTFPKQKAQPAFDGRTMSSSSHYFTISADEQRWRGTLDTRSRHMVFAYRASRHYLTIRYERYSLVKRFISAASSMQK